MNHRPHRGRSRLAALALGLAFCAALGLPAQAGALTIDEVITLTKLEVPDAQIIKKIDKDGSVFKLTPQDILKLKKAGVSDAVIRHMMKTASREPGAAAPVARKEDDKPKRELTAAEKAAEEARLKEESLRLAEEQRRREEAQRKAFAGKQLKRGQALANSKRWVEAIEVFTKFVNEGVGGVPFAPDSDEAYVANYGIANALIRADLLQAAANALLDVVRAGPDKLFFDQAFYQLRALRQKINFRPPELEDLTRFSVVAKDKKLQDSFHYFVGEFLHDFGLSTDAVPYLEKVGEAAADYPRAQFLLGLIAFQDEALELRERVRRASEGFQNAVLAGEEQGEAGQGLVDLAYLSLARLAYEYRQYDAAIYYYRKISPRSPKIARAFYESGWAYFLSGDISRALGIFHALHSPYFRHHFYPELWILEATIYVQNCHVKHAQEAIKRFEEDVLVLGPPLRDFLARHTRPEQFYEAVLVAVNTPRRATLPRNLISPILQNVEFYNIYKTIKQIEREEAILKKNLSRLGTFGQEQLNKLGQLRGERIAEAGVVIQRTLRGVEKDINTYHDKLTDLRIDLQEQELQKADEQIEKLEKKDGAKAAAKAVEQEGGVAIAGSDSMVWPFEGEFWKDEIRAYRSSLRSKCVEDQ
jgi:tetratricopeptide (TPR) repeat protein